MAIRKAKRVLEDSKNTEKLLEALDEIGDIDDVSWGGWGGRGCFLKINN